MPPPAVIGAHLIDVSCADAPAIVLGEWICAPGRRQPPFAFAIAYDPAKIEAKRFYVVQARIEADGGLRFVRNPRYAVIARSAPTRIEMLLKQVGSRGGDGQIEDSAIRAKTLVLRNWPAADIVQDVMPMRMDYADRVSLSALSRLCCWRDAIVVVRPSTVVRWHRPGWRIVWCWRGKAGRKSAPGESDNSPAVGLQPLLTDQEHHCHFP